ncbi:nucleotidyltransferase family protein [Thermosipho ferrireducens]|uniref:Nucleotidyltransferase family protein n=1 Tax=Thermosipho ferrireducens TaxID=2571116 RepID=A0ABX7S8U7_9BACT|nr:nucleotidyltransferase family protein [Thermosipho ferrireducens]QTA38348.1 nucleotidyltransferase family protein [Thermosipho ferrireducens]
MTSVSKVHIEKQKLEKIMEILKKNGAKKIAIFGSRVRNDWKNDSDIDILVEFSKKPSLLEIAGIKLEIEDNIGEKVDLITFDGLDDYIKEKVLNSMVVVYNER